jgi:hypothetical protein
MTGLNKDLERRFGVCLKIDVRESPMTYEPATHSFFDRFPALTIRLAILVLYPNRVRHQGNN